MVATNVLVEGRNIRCQVLVIETGHFMSKVRRQGTQWEIRGGRHATNSPTLVMRTPSAISNRVSKNLTLTRGIHASSRIDGGHRVYGQVDQVHHLMGSTCL